MPLLLHICLFGAVLIPLILLIRRAPEKTETWIRRVYRPLLLVILFGLIILTVVMLFNKGISIDEVEHIHTTWLIGKGSVPYVDFFQHHNPLLWYAMLPVLKAVGETPSLIFVLRLVMLVFTLLGVGMVSLIVRELTGEGEAGLIAAVLLFSQVMYVDFCFKIRPDIPQVFLALCAAYFLMSYLKAPASGRLFLSGFCLSLSFLFLQKTIFLMAAFALILLIGLFRKRISVRGAAFFVLGTAVPLGIFLAWLWKTGMWSDYWLTNWLLNMRFAVGDRFSPLMILNAYILKDIIFWLLAIYCITIAFKGGDGEKGLQDISLMAVVLFGSLFILKRPWGHNFLFPIAFFSILAGCGAHFLFQKLRAGKSIRILLVILIVFMPSYFLRLRTVNDNRHEIRRARFVLQNTGPSDRVYDGKNMFNLFRTDLHYFWFSLKPNHGLDTYNRLTANRYGDYDICELIRRYKPKFISDFQLDLAACGLDKLYDKTPFDNLYILKQ